ncbi:MAG: LacI family DNA-binding transcriptional regulator [Sphaerochaetaceae bacterium]|nr:LacI family DNA-binding transcriptional regulator [Sphaerochaetaceae bacterium]
MATLKDVAEMAGVSIATVSFVLNDKKTISPKTKEKVLSSIEALGYRPNMVAKGFKTKQTKSIAVLVPTITNPVYPSFVNRIEVASRSEGYRVILYSYENDPIKGNIDFLGDLYDRMVDGIIICGIPDLSIKNNSKRNEQIMNAFIERQTPFVFFSEEEQLQYFANICGIPLQSNPNLFHLLTIDRQKATYEVIRHLIETGHRRIAFIAEGTGLTSPQNVPYQKKLAGYKQALAEFGLPLDEKLIITGSDDFRGGDECFSKLQMLTNSPTAFFCTGDTIALGVLHAAHRFRISVPNEVAVIGFDNIPISRYWNPKLSTVAVPTESIAVEAFKRLLWLMKGLDVPSSRMTFDTELIVRESSY